MGNVALLAVLILAAAILYSSVGHAGASAAFILVNSIAGLAGNFSSVRDLPDALPLWALAAGVGALIGTQLGTRHFQNNGIRRALAAVLVIAGLKLMLA
jgi:uncharacterized membrane protein YfcA